MMIYRRSRYDIFLNRPGCLTQEEITKKHFLVYGPRRGGKTTYLINHMGTLPEEDTTCFISDFRSDLSVNRPRGITRSNYSAHDWGSPEHLGVFRGTLYDWVYFDDVKIISVLIDGRDLLERAKKGVYVTTSENDYWSFINQDNWNVINLEAL